MRPQRRSRRFETNVVLLVLTAIAVVTIVVISAWKSSGSGSDVKTGTKKAAANARDTSVRRRT